ncbi:MAG: hypothetical protein PVI38_03210 [Desulfobacterales bacterium]|jgi:signal transduction histidine kinase
MTEKPAYKAQEQRVKQLESEVLEYMRKEKELNEQLKLLEYSHLRRTISLMKINEELKREIEKHERADENLERVTHRLRERAKELKCLYDISSLRAGTNFSLDDVLQEVVDFIPPATEFPEITCARIKFNRYEFTTKNFISAIAESIAQIVELDWAEIEFRKHRNHVEKLIKNSSSNITEK